MDKPWLERELTEMKALLKKHGYSPEDAHKLQAEGMGPYELEGRLKEPDGLERTHGFQKDPKSCDLTLRVRELEQSVNGRIGVSCVRSMLHYWDKGLRIDAKTVWLTDGDKLYQYPELYAAVEAWLGKRV